MRYIIAILSTISVITESLLAPVFLQWYKQTTGVEPMAFYPIGFFIMVLQFVLMVMLWISAINNKSIKDFQW